MFLFLKNSIIFIGPDERGVVISPYEPTGYGEDILTPGRHWIRPLETVFVFNISQETYSTLPASDQTDFLEVQTSDGQSAFIEETAIYSIDPEKVIDLYVTWRDRYQDGLVRPTVRSTTRDITIQYTFDEIVSSKHTEIEQRIEYQLGDLFSENNLILIDFEINDVYLKP
jgi:regulator of protease activity HflC (stomatin/prohibitin superfamily)